VSSIGLFYTILRPEEKAIAQAAESRHIQLQRLRDSELTFSLEPDGLDADVVLNRSVSHSRGLYATRFFEHYGIPTVNTAGVIEKCGDKVVTSLLLKKAGIPTPRTMVALTPESALKALDQVGYPAVLKPPVGSWGRLQAKVYDHDEAQQILEHKSALHSANHAVFYVQEYVPKPDRDIRAMVVGDALVASIYRVSPEWRTNTARGGHAEAMSPTPELTELSLRAAKAVGGGVLAVDLMESPSGLVVHEVNHTPEFKNVARTTNTDIAGRIVDYATEVARR